MLLAFNVGNTHTGVGLFEGPVLRRHWRLVTGEGRTADETVVFLASLLESAGLTADQVAGVVVASVVPGEIPVVDAACREAFGRGPLVVGPGVRTGLSILYDDPRQVGADRIANAVWAHDRFQEPAIVVDLGTATTFDVVSAAGEFLGGLILPGARISLDALISRSARLVTVDLVKPPRVVGRNTPHAIQAGLFYGTADLIDGLVERIRSEIGSPARVVATGGLAPLLAPVSRTIEEVCEHLTLEGLRLIFDRNR